MDKLYSFLISGEFYHELVMSEYDTLNHNEHDSPEKVRFCQEWMKEQDTYKQRFGRYPSANSRVHVCLSDGSMRYFLHNLRYHKSRWKDWHGEDRKRALSFIKTANRLLEEFPDLWEPENLSWLNS